MYEAYCCLAKFRIQNSESGIRGQPLGSGYAFQIPNSEFQIQSAAVSTIGDGRRIMRSRSAPAGTIGYTESSCSTWKSITAARFWRRADSTAPATSPRVVMVAAEIPYASASFWKFGPVIGVAA